MPSHCVAVVVLWSRRFAGFRAFLAQRAAIRCKFRTRPGRSQLSLVAMLWTV